MTEASLSSHVRWYDSWVRLVAEFIFLAVMADLLSPATYVSM
jgi:hypothetical protein